MQVVDFTREHIEAAQAIGYQNFGEERQAVPELPEVDTIPNLDEFAENGLGVAAIHEDKILGYLCCWPPFKNAFHSAAIGVFSPIHAHGAIMENRPMIYQRMYQAAAKKWVRHKATSHAIALYAHDRQALDTFFMYGFGVRCVDAVRLTDQLPCRVPDAVTFQELPKSNLVQVREMRRLLAEHMGNSPCFMVSLPQDIWDKIAEAEQCDSRVFAAFCKGAPVAFLEICNSGETFISEIEGTKNICGAFCRPEYRGTGLFQSLLNHVMLRLHGEGYRYFGVDFESFNPTANGFWSKYFSPYTNSVVRRIDDCALCGDWEITSIEVACNNDR